MCREKAREDICRGKDRKTFIEEGIGRGRNRKTFTELLTYRKRVKCKLP